MPFSKSNEAAPLRYRFKCMLFNFFHRNKFRIGKNNTFDCRLAFLKQTAVEIHGSGNSVIIGAHAHLTDCRIVLYGNNHVVRIGNDCSLRSAELWTEDSGCTIDIGDHTTTHGHVQFAAMESTDIIIGEDCMLSNDISFRTGDSHSIVNAADERVNASESIVIGRHCWIGTRVICLKGAMLGDNCIVGAGSVLSARHPAANCILAGVPAKVIKENMNWKRER